MEAAYRSGKSTTKDFTDPTIFYLQHILGKIILAKKNADKVGRLEISVLKLLKDGEVDLWGHYLCKHFQNLRVVAPVACGGMVTYIPRHLHPSSVPADHTILQYAYADRVWFQSG